MNAKKKILLFYGILSGVALLFLLFFSYGTSPLFTNNYGISDSSVFLIIGKEIANGAVPYIDIFDHKGPILFFLEALGWLIKPNGIGIFFIQWIFMTLNLIIILKIGALFFNKKLAWILIIFFLLILASTFEGGNLTEEYCLPFLLLPLYLSLKYFKKLPQGIPMHPPLYALVYGMCFTLIVFIRLNNAVLICAIVLVVMIQLLSNKAYRNFFDNALTFLSGSFGVFSVIAIYFLINHAFGEMIYGTFLFNMKYAEGLTGITTPDELVKFAYSVSPVIFSGAMGIIYLFKKENLYIGLILIIGSAATFFSLLLGGVFYHYFILTTPCFILGIILMIDLYVKNRKRIWVEGYRPVAIVIGMLFIGTAGIYLNFLDETINDIAINQPQRDYYENALSIKSSIPQGDLDSVFGYSVPAGWFLMADITPCYKYFTLQEWWGLYDPEVILETNEMLENNPPKWIVMNNDKQTNQIIYDILATKYQLVTQDKVVALYHLSI
ncbi:hypothetical protein [Acetobacterium bakii]|uniref:Glycosyltransferase RgtA/B/C/D-like domain-containing protein n=1 Tax=Acetobacterium bakii TaxID=52689 RepID=A0A0L6TV69_9FIRM|nr:hypothetical protein [Acetobacterium bakii]KNZ40174.1 hypothetical protein AKG39_19025 [Acetobacterium bakii]